MSTLEVKQIQAPTGYDLQMPSGAIIQVVGGSRVGDFATTSTSFTAQGLTATITPKFASSKILITTLCGFSVPSNDALYFNIERNVGGSGTNLHSHNEGFGGAQSVTYRGCHTLNYLDSPSTTSAITYKLLVRCSGGNTVEVPAWANALQNNNFTGGSWIMASKIKVDQLETADGSGTIALQNQLSGMTSASMPTGSVVQVVQFRESTAYSTTSNSYVQGPQTGTFTMKDSSNKVLVRATALMEAQTGGAYNGVRMAIYRGSIASGTRIDNGTEPQLLDYGQEIWSFQTREVLDTPSSSTVTYSIGFNKHSTASTGLIQGGLGETTITMMEIAG